MVACESAIESVVVYAHGAEVSRRVEVEGALPEGACELIVSGLTPVAQAGSLRVEVEGARAVTSLSTRLVFDQGRVALSALDGRLAALRAERDQVDAVARALRERREALLEAEPEMRLRGRRRSVEPDVRVSDALAVCALIEGCVGELEEEIDVLDVRREELERELEGLELERAQATGEERAAEGHPTREVTLSVAPGEGGLEGLRLVYAVGPARWWPCYAIRLSEQGHRAEVALEAYVVQTTLESWEDVELALSTAERVSELALPELPSQRLGRRQPPRDRGFRPPPEGLDALFRPYDEAARRAGLERTVAAEDTLQRQEREAKEALREQVKARAEADRVDMMPAFEAQAAPIALEERSMSRSSFSLGGPKRKSKKSLSRARSMTFDVDDGAAAPGGGFGGMTGEVEGGEGEGVLEVSDDWLDYDNLVLKAPEQAPSRRGQLVRAPARSTHPSAREAERRIEAVDAPVGAVDPGSDRGVFDYRYEASGRAKIPSDGGLHRVSLRVEATDATPRFRTVPIAEPLVFRESTLHNPFDAPLLTGPLDVFVEGALVVSTTLERIDRGGEIRFGLGVEERVQVSRNLRMKERTSRHLLGSRSHAHHHVVIELASSLDFPAEVEVIDRLPVTDDDEITITEVAHTPEARDYHQRERGAHVRGGLCWSIPLEPGERAEIVLDYTLELAAKLEVQGGNRRD